MSEYKQIDPLYFKFRGKIARLLGRESVSDSIIALVELVKNSYDADATDVHMVFENVRAGNGVIKISDNGIGLNLFELDKNWMSVATDDKEKNPLTKRNKRRKIGEKGIGRFATEKLARKVDIVSRPDGETTGYKLSIDWDEYEKDGVYCTTIPNPAWEFKKKRKDCGFEIILSGLRDKWDEDKIKVFRKNVSLLIPPVGRSRKDRFEPRISADEFPRYTGKIRSAFLLQAIFVFSAELEKDGTIRYSFKEKNKKAEKDSDHLRDFSCGPMNLLLYFFYRDKNKYPNEDVDIKSIRSTLDDFSGVKLYRDNFLVKLQEYDWIGLDALRINDPSNYPSNNQVFGFVKISKETNPGIKDTTTREGIIKNYAYNDMINFLQKSIKKFVDIRKAAERDIKTGRKIKKAARKTKAPVSKISGKKEPQSESFIDFRRKYPEVFYVKLENEINVCFETDLPNAALLLSRKLVENLVYNLFEIKYPKDIGLRWDTTRNRPHDFARLIDNLADRKNDFDQEQKGILGRLLQLIPPFKREANSKAHNIMDYIDDKSELNRLKIPEIIELSLKLLDKVRNSAKKP